MIIILYQNPKDLIEKFERKVQFLPSKRLRKHLKALKMFPMSWPEKGGWKEVGDDRRWCSLVGMVLGWLMMRERRERRVEKDRGRGLRGVGLERKKKRNVWRGNEWSRKGV